METLDKLMDAAPDWTPTKTQQEDMTIEENRRKGTRVRKKKKAEKNCGIDYGMIPKTEKNYSILRQKLKFVKK